MKEIVNSEKWNEDFNKLMEDVEAVRNQGVVIIEEPTYEWKCELFGCGDAITLHRKEGGQPNWFWRKMQHLILGNRWYLDD